MKKDPDCRVSLHPSFYGIWLTPGATQGGRAAVHRYGHCSKNRLPWLLPLLPEVENRYHRGLQHLLSSAPTIQLSQDLASTIIPHLPCFRGSCIRAGTTLPIFVFRYSGHGNIPNMVYLAPTCREEYMAMLEWASVRRNIRLPSARRPMGCPQECRTREGLRQDLNCCRGVHRGEKVAIGTGLFSICCEAVAARLKGEEEWMPRLSIPATSRCGRGFR